ncbi:telomeric repeat-binding factor 2-interacting protein 1 isoform 2-T2 [Pholidichthys leucotaenia]
MRETYLEAAENKIQKHNSKRSPLHLHIFTMSSKKQDVAKPAFSPVLFMTVDGEPMCFYLRPGPIKHRLQPLITAGGGMMCSFQKPGAILLMDPEERRSSPKTTAHLFVSVQYIYDCIEKDEQLDLDDYRLNPEVPQRQSPRLGAAKESSSRLTGGRIGYSPEEDAAILDYVSSRMNETGGNRLWREMENERVTSHPWQSMKYHYKEILAKKQSAAMELEGVPGTKQEANPPQTCSVDTDQTQVDSQLLPAESTTARTEAQVSTSPKEKQQTDENQAESSQPQTVESEASPSAEGPCEDLEADTQLITYEAAEPPTTVTPQEQSLPEDSSPVEPKGSQAKKSSEKQKTSPAPDPPLRRMTRRQLQLEPFSKRLRSSSSLHATLSTSFPQPLRKTKSTVKSTFPKEIIAQPPAKKAKEMSVSAEPQIQQEEGRPTAVSILPHTDEPNLEPQKAEEKKTEKRKLGVLEMATKELEDDSESDEGEATDLQNAAETEATSKDPLPPSSNTAVDSESTQLDPQPGPSQTPAEAHASTEPSGSKPVKPSEAATADPVVSEPVGVTSKVHLFIFESESESREEDSQSVGEQPASPSSPQAKVNEVAPFSLTQDQLEEDKQKIRDLMNETEQDLVTVIKVLLKTSGDFSAARLLLLNPLSVTGPIWNRQDDSLLLSADPDTLRQLQEKYGEESVAKRIMFLEIEG